MHLSLMLAYVGAQIRHQGRQLNWQDYAPTTVETPGQLPMVNGVPIPGAVINPNCTEAGQITCLYWAGAGLNNANILGSIVGVNGATVNTVPYANYCTATVLKSCFVNTNWSGLSSVVYDANTSYNSFQMALERRVSGGLFARFNYTLSKCMEDSSDDLPSSELNGGGAAWSPSLNHSANRHRCSFQGENSANFNLTYDFPFGRNAQTRMEKALLSGWQLTSLTAISSGLPFDVRLGANVARASNSAPGNGRPDIAPGCTPDMLINKGKVQNYINVSCLTTGTPGYLGDMAPLMLTGPGTWNTDVGLKKNISIKESKTLQLGADMFNAFNRVNLSVPASTTAFTNLSGTLVPNNGAGSITTTVTTSRQFQIGAKFTF